MRIIGILLILQIIFVDPQDGYKLIGTLRTDGNLFYSDPIGNIYIIHQNSIRKYNLRLDKLADYSNTYLGNITSVDVSDPLRILLYYKEFNQIVWLDNFLQELRSPIRLDDLLIDQVNLVCSSSQGGFWVYNRLNNQIQYFDATLRLIHESINLQSLIGKQNPSCMIEKSSIVYLNVPETGILLFDRFGTYFQTLPVFSDKNLQVTDENIFYTRHNAFHKFNISTYTNTIINLPDTIDLKGVMMQQEYLYLFKKDGIYTYLSTRSD
ncbi:MAG: hypothetical protein AMS27_06190 [Bacteroides sp. SM23_62_1]|nr:MAG: hypothetical protein AMS27_06190 [Bacteroides sp. SM23_62_1]